MFMVRPHSKCATTIFLGLNTLIENTHVCLLRKGNNNLSTK